MISSIDFCRNLVLGATRRISDFWARPSQCFHRAGVVHQLFRFPSHFCILFTSGIGFDPAHYYLGARQRGFHVFLLLAPGWLATLDHRDINFWEISAHNKTGLSAVFGLLPQASLTVHTAARHECEF